MLNFIRNLFKKKEYDGIMCYVDTGEIFEYKKSKPLTKREFMKEFNKACNDPAQKRFTKWSNNELY